MIGLNYGFEFGRIEYNAFSFFPCVNFFRRIMRKQNGERAEASVATRTAERPNRRSRRCQCARDDLPLCLFPFSA